MSKKIVNTNEEENEESEYRVFSKTIVYIVFIPLILSIVGAGLYDILIKPGVGQISRFILNIISLGTEVLRNAAYSAASLDPSQLPSLITIYVILYSPMILFGILTGIQTGSQAIKRLERDFDHDKAFSLKLIKRKKKIYFVIGIISIIALQIPSSIIFAIINNAVAINRIFHANLTICSPYISNQDERQFRSKFAMVNTKKDYQPIEDDLRQIAKTNGVKLRDEKVW